MILALKNGWLIAVKVVRKTRSGVHIEYIDDKTARFLSKKDSSWMLCNTTDEAFAFVNT